MADVFRKEKRSSIMSQVRSSGNKSTELKMIEYFSSNHITGWRRNYKAKGHPDFVFLDRKIAIFVDGVFGTDTIVETPVPPITQIIGLKSESEIFSTIK